MKIKMILAFVLGSIFMIIVLQNTEVVSFKFLLWHLSMSRIVLLPLIFTTGLVVGFIYGKK